MTVRIHDIVFIGGRLATVVRLFGIRLESGHGTISEA